LGSGKHGDAMRLLAGGGTAASQIEYTNKYGSALPVFFTQDKQSPGGNNQAAGSGDHSCNGPPGGEASNSVQDKLGRVADRISEPKF
jgi:hypothetical protein